MKDLRELVERTADAARINVTNKTKYFLLAQMIANIIHKMSYVEEDGTCELYDVLRIKYDSKEVSRYENYFSIDFILSLLIDKEDKKTIEFQTVSLASDWINDICCIMYDETIKEIKNQLKKRYNDNWKDCSVLWSYLQEMFVESLRSKDKAFLRDCYKKRLKK